MLKHLLLLLVISAFTTKSDEYLTIDRLTSNLDTLKQQCQDIMSRLKVPLRQDTSLDGKIRINVYQQHLYFNAEFSTTIKISRKPDGNLDTINRFYPEPQINLTSITDSVSRKLLDTTRKIYIMSIGTFVHELTHYYQASYSDTSTFKRGSKADNYRSYFMQPVEFEAYAVEAYFFLYFYDRDKLKKILSSKKSRDGTQKALINAYFAIKNAKFVL